MGKNAGPIAMSAQAGGGIMSAYGTYEAGQANAAILRTNAQFERTKAQQTLEAGEYQAGVIDERSTQLAGKQAVSFASQGVVAGAGSAATIVTASEAVSDQDKAMARLNARRQAYGYNIAAANDEFQADMAKRTANMQAAGTLLSTAGQVGMTAMMI